MSHLIEFQKLEKYYEVAGEKILIIKGVDLVIDEGQTVAILGKSGSGKSTMLNILGLLDRHTGGKYLLNDKDVNLYTGDELATIRARNFGFIFQQFNLLPKLTVLENVTAPIYYSRNQERWNNRDKIGMELLERVGIADQAKKYPKLLSGGQQQRVAIARSLANEPKVIIGDEPTGALDSKTTDQVIGDIFKLNEELGVTFILVTHDEELATRCHKIVHLKDGVVV
jgi:putative ABC transport system ATP-binding protein